MIIAPMAPMAPAWLTVATPRMIEPRTMKISVSGGTSASTTRTMNLWSYLPSNGTGGALAGLISADPRMYSM